jgi:hypothetical protein
MRERWWGRQRGGEKVAVALEGAGDERGLGEGFQGWGGAVDEQDAVAADEPREGRERGEEGERETTYSQPKIGGPSMLRHSASRARMRTAASVSSVIFSSRIDVDGLHAHDLHLGAHGVPHEFPYIPLQ